MERTICTSLLGIAAISFALGQTQIINGSFEDEDGPTLIAWEWTCADPGLDPDAPPNGGQWNATKEASHAKGCFPSLLYQRLPGAFDGELRTLQGWVRCDAGFFCPGAYIGFGSVNNGTFKVEETTGTTDVIWTFVSITDTMELSDGDTAIAVLNGGFTGGPVNPSVGHFDAIALLLPLGVGTDPAPTVSAYLDRASGLFHLATTENDLSSLSLFDLSGRALPVSARRTSPRAFTVDINDLPTGVYLVNAATDKGIRTIRFVKD